MRKLFSSLKIYSRKLRKPMTSEVKKNEIEGGGIIAKDSSGRLLDMKVNK